MKKIFICIFCFVIILCNYVYAHKGRTDGYGGHYNSSTGTYHYHSGKYSNTGEYTNPIEEGGKKIDEEENELYVVDTDKNELYITDTYEDDQNKIDELNNEIEYLKEENDRIEIEKNSKIEELESQKENLHIIYIFIIIIGIVYSYNYGKNN